MMPLMRTGVSFIVTGLILVVSCQSPVGSTPAAVQQAVSFTGAKTSVVPGQITTTIPSSLMTGGTTAAKSLSGAVAPASNSYAVDKIKQVTAKIKKLATKTAVRMLMVDSVIAQNTLTATDPAALTLVTGKTITVDQSYLDKLDALLPAAVRDDGSADRPSLGKAIKVPDFRYETVPAVVPAVAGDPVYNLSFTIPVPAGSDDPVFILKWSSDKKLTSMSLAYTDGSESGSITMTYDAVAGLSKFIQNVTDSEGSQLKVVTLQTDPASTANGVFVTFDSTNTKLNNNVASTVSISATGYADDNGGFLGSVAKSQDGTTIVPTGETHKEDFNRTGDLTYAHTTKDDGTETDDIGKAPAAASPHETKAKGQKPEDQVKMKDNSKIKKDMTSAKKFLLTVNGVVQDKDYVVFDTANLPTTLTGLAPDKAPDTGKPLGFAEGIAADQVKIELIAPLTATTTVNFYLVDKKKDSAGKVTVDLTLVNSSPITLTKP